MIRVQALHVDLGGRAILTGVGLAVGRGDAVALVGPNGAGKTTLLRCVVGLVRYRGRLEVSGIDVARDPVAAKRAVGYMPQVPAFLEETARGALAFVAALRGAPARGIDPLLERVGLAAHRKRAVRTFSTGMKQRLSLAAALCGDPEVLVLDEPTASLDLQGQAEFATLIRGLEDEGKTVLMTSHRAEEARALAERLVVLDEGRIVAEGPVDEVASTIWGAPAPAQRSAQRHGWLVSEASR